jgi:hypothetical protein
MILLLGLGCIYEIIYPASLLSYIFYYRAFVNITVTRDMKIEYRASLLPQGEGQDEGFKIETLAFLIPSPQPSP